MKYLLDLHRISWASKSDGSTKENKPQVDKAGRKYLSGTTSASVHVTFVTLQVSFFGFICCIYFDQKQCSQAKMNVTEETLRSMFSVYGNVIDAVVKKTVNIGVSFVSLFSKLFILIFCSFSRLKSVDTGSFTIWTLLWV